jgi:hypothetical protein
MSRLSSALCLLVVVLASCSQDAPAPTSQVRTRPSTDARIRITYPRDGQSFHSDGFMLKLSLHGAQITRKTSSELRPDRGHVHVSVDNRIVSMSYGLQQRVRRLRPGVHLLRAEFVASDHEPFDPRVFDQVTFTVKPQ